jgi:hypothetical protein
VKESRCVLSNHALWHSPLTYRKNMSLNGD